MNNAIILVFAALAMTACTKQAATVTPPTAPASPNVGVLVALNGLALGCEFAADDVDPSVATWLTNTCPAAATGIINVVEANGDVAKIQSVIDTMKAAALNIPSTAKGFMYVTQGIDLAQGVLNIYEEATGETVTASAAPPGASQLFARAKASRRKIKWSHADKARIAALKAKLAAKK